MFLCHFPLISESMRSQNLCQKSGNGHRTEDHSCSLPLNNLCDSNKLKVGSVPSAKAYQTAWALCHARML